MKIFTLRTDTVTHTFTLNLPPSTLNPFVMMMKASGVGCTLEMNDIPTLPGALECIRKGIFSSLQPQNLKMKRTIINPEEAQAHEIFPLLFDPQTAGGLLATVPFDQVLLTPLKQPIYTPNNLLMRIYGQGGSPQSMEGTPLKQPVNTYNITY